MVNQVHECICCPTGIISESTLEISRIHDLIQTIKQSCQRERQLSKRSFTNSKTVEEAEEVVVVEEVEVEGAAGEVEGEAEGEDEGVEEVGVEVEGRLVDLGIVQREDLVYHI